MPSAVPSPQRPSGRPLSAPRRWLPRSERGTALMAAMCFATVLAISVSSYLTLCYRTLALSDRSLQGSRSIQLAETGMEDALWALNHNNWTDWTITGTTARRTLTGLAFEGGATGQVSLTITNYDGSSGTRVVQSTGTITQADGTAVSRTVTSTSARAPLFVNAVAATTSRVRFRSAGTVDSYDSALGDYTAQTPGFSAILSSGSTSTSSATVQLANAQVKGYVATVSTGPSYSTSAKLIGPSTPSRTNIDTSRISSSPYQPLFDEVRPSGAGLTLPSGTATIGTAGATAETIYYASNVLLSGTQVLTVDGPVALVITGDLYITDYARIRITTRGSLRVHLSGDLAINGGGIQNDTKLPKKLIVISTTNPYDSFGMATNTPFYGVIYTPVSSLTVSNSQAIYGAIVARSVTFSASPQFHYDIDLRRTVFNGLDTPFAVSDVRESTGN
ncbi:MAG: hypothetical protein HZC55_23880 [Verrucomicrobia bacterium]|nr:hypothetical protein [Verrucomicrobiota bacterium]